MIQYKKIAENIAEIKNIFDEEIGMNKGFNLGLYMRDNDTEHMTPQATGKPNQYFFSIQDIRWCNDFEGDGNDWDDENDEWDWDYLYMELKKLGIKVIDWDDEGIYVEF